MTILFKNGIGPLVIVSGEIYLINLKTVLDTLYK